MAKLADDPKVQDLVAKAADKATKTTIKTAVDAVKEAVSGLIEGAGDDKAAIKAFKLAQTTIVRAIKGA